LISGRAQIIKCQTDFIGLAFFLFFQNACYNGDVVRIKKTEKKIKKIAVLGVGYFGYAILKHFDQKNSRRKLSYEVCGYDVNEKIVNHLRKKRSHPYLFKNTKLGSKIVFETSLKSLVKDCDLLILAVNSDATRGVLQHAKKYINKPLIVLNTAKALDYQTGKGLSEIIENILADKLEDYALLAGGTIAKDLFAHEPLGASLACQNGKVLKNLTNILSSSNLFIYPTSDLKGVEYASAFKNVVAILAGITKGMGFSYGSETHIISRTALEIEELAVYRLGAKKDTFSLGSQCWGNDLLMSCTGDTRNRKFGIYIGEGMKPKAALAKMEREHQTVEGVKTLEILNKICDLKKYPQLNLLHKLVLEKISLEEFKNYIFVNIQSDFS